MADSSVTTKVLVNLLLVAVGYLIKRSGLLATEDGRILNRVVLYVTLPAMNLKVIGGAELSWTLLILPVVFLLAAVVTSTLSRFPARWLQLSRPDSGTFIVSLCGVMGSLAYPFAEAAYGEDGARVVAISDLGNAIGIFALAYYISFLYSGHGHFGVRPVLRKLATFFPLHAFLLALVFNLLHIRLTGLAGGLLDALASMNTPLMLLSLGVYLELDVSLREGRVLLTQLLFKYGIGLAIAFLCAALLPFRGSTRAVAFMFALMPTGLSTLIYSVEQDLNPRLAAMLISVTMVVSLVIASVIVIGFRDAF